MNAKTRTTPSPLASPAEPGRGEVQDAAGAVDGTEQPGLVRGVGNPEALEVRLHDANQGEEDLEERGQAGDALLQFRHVNLQLGRGGIDGGLRDDIARPTPEPVDRRRSRDAVACGEGSVAGGRRSSIRRWSYVRLAPDEDISAS